MALWHTVSALKTLAISVYGTHHSPGVGPMTSSFLNCQLPSLHDLHHIPLCVALCKTGYYMLYTDTI